MDRGLNIKSGPQKQSTILLVTITTYNISHVQLGMYNLKAYFLHKILKDKASNHFDIIVEAINPKKNINRKSGDFYPVFTKVELSEIAEKLINKNPTIIGFSCFMWNMNYLLVIARIIKKKCPLIKIILGGPEISYKAQSVMEKHKYIDVVAINDGEETFYELVRHFDSGKNTLDAIHGILFRRGGKIIKTIPRTSDLRKLPSPYLNNLIDITNKKKGYIVETLRGCPFRCAYCSYHLGAYGRVRYFPIERVHAEFKLLLEHDVPHLIITDDNFNIDESRAKQILKYIIRFKRKTIVDVYLNIYIRKLGEEFLELLSRTNIFLAIGIQSTNVETLKRIKRSAVIQLLKDNLLALNERKIRYEIQFIVGLPGDTYADFVKNIEWGLQFHPYKISFFQLSVISGTEIFEKVDKYHIDYKKSPPYTIFRTPTFTQKEIKKAMKVFDSVNLLYNLGLLRQTLLYMNEHYNIEYYHVFYEWFRLMSSNESKNKQLYPLVVAFVMRILSNKKIPFSENEKVFEYVRKDFSLYCKTHIKGYENKK